MKKNHYIIIILFLFFLIIGFVFISLNFTQARELEVEYPAVPGASPPSTGTSLPDYVRYVFTFIVTVSGIIGVSVLILAGIRYLTSAGQPEKLKEARGQILSAFWGIIILLGSLIILYTINPRWISLEIIDLPEIPAAEMPSPPIYSIPTSILLERIKELAEDIKDVSDVIKKTTEKIKELTDKCDCENTQSICACEGKGQAKIDKNLSNNTFNNGFDIDYYENNEYNIQLAAAGQVTNVNSSNFGTEVLGASNQQPVLVQFGTKSCPACRVMEPTINSIAAENPGVKVVKIDPIQNPDLMSQYKVRQWPTDMVFKDGEPVTLSNGQDRYIGVQSKQTLVNDLNKYKTTAPPEIPTIEPPVEPPIEEPPIIEPPEEEPEEPIEPPEEEPEEPEEEPGEPEEDPGEPEEEPGEPVSGRDLICKPKTCYIGEKSNPCPDKEEIKELQKQIIDQKDVILYYRNRVITEKYDLEIDIEEFINKKIDWYENAIQELSGEQDNQEVIDMLREKKQWMEEEKKYKEELVQKLEQLIKPIEEMELPASKIPQLSSQCLSNVEKKCQPKCKQGKDYGCHDTVKGCQPDKCSGGNPCPSDEIQSEISKIEQSSQENKRISDEIISIVDSIKKEKESNTIF